MSDALREAREQQVRLQANGAAVLFILAMSTSCGLRWLGLSAESMWLVGGVLATLVVAGVFGLSPRD